MPLWRIEPIADWDDPVWQDRGQWEMVIVRAPSPAFARTIAATLDTPSELNRYGVENATIGSGFTSEKLYHVSPQPPGAFEEAGLDGIVAETRRSGPVGP